MTRLIAELTRRGRKVATIKHDGHDFEPDVPETDSWRHRQSGAYGTAVFSGKRFLVTKECSHIDETQLIQAFPEAEIILIEGLKHSHYPKYVCHWPDEPLPDAEILADEVERMMEAES